MVAMKLVVGLGNPGDRYVGTRHNVGFDVVERVASRIGAELGPEKRLASLLGRGRIGDEDVWLLEPRSYMNNSGPAVARVVRERDLELSDLLVVTDDYHLPLGKLRLRASGSAGGHNGMKSIIQALGSNEFPRLRIGVGEPGQGQAVDHVLSRFRPAERDTIDEALDRSADCTIDWCTRGVTAVMNEYNG